MYNLHPLRGFYFNKRMVLDSVILELCEARELDAPGFRPADWLTPAEEAALAAFPTDKRRRDWLAGRVAAKRALSKASGRPARECAVEPDALGRPKAAGLDVSLSITHCELGGAAAALAGGQVGVDWEPVRPLSARAIELFAGPEELAGQDGDEAAIRLWTLKEAALKLLGLGLSDGGRAARVALGESPRVEFSGAALDAWRALGAPKIEFHERRDGKSCLSVARTGG